MYSKKEVFDYLNNSKVYVGSVENGKRIRHILDEYGFIYDKGMRDPSVYPFIYTIDGHYGCDISMAEFDRNKNKLMYASEFLVLENMNISDNTTNENNKKNDVKLPNNEFKTFDKVIVRDRCEGYSNSWTVDFFSHMDNDMYICVGGVWDECLPYEGNEHLVGIK